MSVFGEVAVESAKMVISGVFTYPRDAWEQCMDGKNVSDNTKSKPCPQNTFLGLCEDGYIKGIPAGNYTESVKNKDYGIRALKALIKNPALNRNQQELWRRIDIDNDRKRHNSQMDVVISLWNSGLLRK